MDKYRSQSNYAKERVERYILPAEKEGERKKKEKSGNSSRINDINIVIHATERGCFEKNARTNANTLHSNE